MISSIGNTGFYGYAQNIKPYIQQAAPDQISQSSGRDEFLSSQETDAAISSVSYSRQRILDNYFQSSAHELSGSSDGEDGYSREEEQMLEELKTRDTEVKRHEQTHAAILGPYARGAPVYTYQMGPDGRMYAIGGSVSADIGKEATPEETARKARVLQMAALVVDDPSAADIAIASQAESMALEAFADAAAG